MQEERPGLEEGGARNAKTDKFKRYLLEDRKKTLVPLKRTKVNQEPPPEEPKLRPKKSEKTLRRQVWEGRIPVDQYKNLNAAAKQKYRTFKVQKRFTPSASMLLITDKQKKERAGKNVEMALRGVRRSAEAQRYLAGEEEEEEGEGEAEEASEKGKQCAAEGSKQLVVKTETDDVTKYKEYIFQQLRQLKKENEELKKRLTELLQDRNLQSSLQAQDKLELERTKLKACWLIMSSTMDAFSNFCKKFTTKPEEQILEGVKELEAGDAAREHEEEEDLGEEDEGRSGKKHANVSRYDDHYYRFLEKLMDGHLEAEKKRCQKL